MTEDDGSVQPSFPVLHGLKRLEPLTFIDDVVVDPAVDVDAPPGGDG